MKRAYKIALICALQVLILVVIIGFKYQTLYSGTPVLLKTAPLDPWDMFRGEYVRLNYEISRVKLTGIDYPADVKEGHRYNRKVYVVVEQTGKYWRVAGIYAGKPAAGPGLVIMKAKTGYYDNHLNELWLTYGIESYYVPQGQGKELEQSKSLDITVRVDRFGNAVIEDVSKT